MKKYIPPWNIYGSNTRRKLLRTPPLFPVAKYQVKERERNEKATRAVLGKQDHCRHRSAKWQFPQIKDQTISWILHETSDRHQHGTTYANFTLSTTIAVALAVAAVRVGIALSTRLRPSRPSLIISVVDEAFAVARTAMALRMNFRHNSDHRAQPWIDEFPETSGIGSSFHEETVGERNRNHASVDFMQDSGRSEEFSHGQANGFRRGYSEGDSERSQNGVQVFANQSFIVLIIFAHF